MKRGGLASTTAAHVMKRAAMLPGANTGNQRGQSLLEFALALPILLLIVTGIATFGIALNTYLTLTNAVAQGGQFLSVSRGQTLDPCADTDRKSVV